MSMVFARCWNTFNCSDVASFLCVCDVTYAHISGLQTGMKTMAQESQDFFLPVKLPTRDPKTAPVQSLSPKTGFDRRGEIWIDLYKRCDADASTADADADAARVTSTHSSAAE